MSKEVQKVAIPERFGVFYVRALNPIEDIARMDALAASGEDRAKMLAAQLSAYACNEQGEQLYPTPDAALAYMSLPDSRASVVGNIIIAGGKLNSLNDDAVEDAEKN